MSTKLSRYAEGIMEAAWLAAIVMAPLFFNKYSSRIFEPDKATLLRALSLIILFAWCVKFIDQVITSNKRKHKNISIKDLIKIPLVLPIILLGLAYIISTIFSVTPRISFWGSYQRLQGMYTSFAYLVLFASLIGNLKERAQVERIVTTAVLTSLPISLYGVLQHFGIDPIPWGGDVTRRVASHLGNPIFVAAFLIMVFPLTVGRIVNSFSKILKENEGLGYHTARSTIYIFIASLQLIAIYYSRSRGPLLGLLAGVFFLFILLSLHWRLRWLIVAVTIVGMITGGFLLALNIPNGPLESVRGATWVGRLGQILDTDQRTSQVRIQIWQGVAEMVAPHKPLGYPDGHTDPYNFLRPIIGYGPETMHMAYNPFYPPELAYVEKRNASPDRSHNETWDSLVITGGLGLFSYLGFFAVIFYHGLKWLGLIKSKKQKTLFIALYIGGGIISVIGFYFWQGVAFFGVALPFGAILGLIGYLTLSALFTKTITDNGDFISARPITLIMLLSAIMAHFVEINFGIAIVATRTYFFVDAALLLAVGNLLPKKGEYNLTGLGVDVQDRKINFSRRKRKIKSRRSTEGNTTWIRAVVLGGGITGLLILPMNYEYISNLWGQTSASQILWTSFTQVKQGVVSFGVFALILTTWLSASIILTSEIEDIKKFPIWWKTFGSILGISIFIGLFYGFWLSGSLASLARMEPSNIEGVISQTAGLEGLLTQFYTFVILTLLLLGLFLPSKWPINIRNESFFSPIFAVTGFVFVIWLIVTSNLRIIHADIAFKMAEPFANSQQWEVANNLYRRAIELSPDEDYYYLFLGRGSLESAKAISDPVQQEKAFKTAETDLVHAQTINPLNPDHTANLARLYSWWALQATDENTRHERGKISDQYYSKVTVLSPNLARLWNEWAILYLNVINDPEKAGEILSHSLDIDPRYDWTHAITGDYYTRIAQNASADRSTEFFEQAVYHYQEAIKINPKSTNYYFALASAYQSLNDVEMIISTLESSLQFAGNRDIWKIEDNLAHYYLQINNVDTALMHARSALAAAPDSEHERLQTVIDQLQNIP